MIYPPTLVKNPNIVTKFKTRLKANAAIILIATSQEPKGTRTNKQHAEQSTTTSATQQPLFYEV